MRMLVGSGARPRNVDVAIAGGGLAGSAAAAVLARKGIDVALVDPHTVYPPDLRCEKLDGSQVECLRRTGLADLVLPAAAAYPGFWIARFGRVIEERTEAQYGILYDALVNRVRATIPPGVRIVAGKVSSIENGAGRQVLTLSTGERICARLVVLASGLNTGLRSSLGIEREQVSRRHCVTLAFGVAPTDRAAFAFPALTYHGERPADRIAYVTLFPVPGGMRANVMVYREAADPWLRAMRDRPAETLLRTLPGLAAITGRMQATGAVAIRPADLCVSRHHLLPGVVLVGDAFATSCPAAGTGTNKVFTDVHLLCNVYLPQWLRSPGMGIDKLSAFYRDPAKVACDQDSMRRAFGLRSETIDGGMVPGARRWGRFLKGVARGRRGEAARRAAAKTVAAASTRASAADRR